MFCCCAAEETTMAEVASTAVLEEGNPFHQAAGEMDLDGWRDGGKILDGYEKPREEALKATEEKISFWKQLRVACWTMLGPTALCNVCLTALAFPRLVATGKSFPLLPGFKDFLLRFLAMELLGDFFLYVGHRILHEYLWDYHKYHHLIDTPTAVSTACIDGLDATVQAGIPTMGAAVLMQPHPLTFCAYAYARVAENVLNHCGMEHWLLNLVFLKFLPGRAGVANHDAHHRYSNYAKNAKNFGENFWLWDWAFGTLGHVGSTKKF
ncbi:unnamed protein product [Durusdinium trenchii]|uniref:Fatty acid hydroxylase domain-containing protein n=1 Tax=Durusdinium trenchii TaxID=1381693 RepID=A0ABP0R572_9DINO